MSYFNEFLLPKVTEITNAYVKSINDELKAASKSIEQFEEIYIRGKSREKAQKNKNCMTTLQSIREDEDEKSKKANADSAKKSANSKTREIASSSSNESVMEKTKHASKKRSKHEVDGMSSPEQEKRQKRSASVKAQNYIKKQVNVNLSQKLRREDTTQKSNSYDRDNDKENEPILNIKIKQEKISMPAEPEATEMEMLPVNALKTEDGLAMPPPMAPVPKPRTKLAKEMSVETNEEENGKRHSTRTRKQTDTLPVPVSSSRSTRDSSRTNKQPDNEEPAMPPPEPRSKRTKAKKKRSEDANPEPDTVNEAVPTQNGLVSSSRSTRASSRTTKQLDNEEPAMPPPEPRPKRTRAKKKRSEHANPEPDKVNEAVSTENGLGSPTEKPRPKRTRRGQKAADKTEQNTQLPAEELTVPDKTQNLTTNSPILRNTKDSRNISKAKLDLISKTIQLSTNSTDANDKTRVISNDMDKTRVIPNDMDKTRVIANDMDKTTVIANDMDKTRVIPNANMDETVVVPNGVFNHQPVTPKNIININETVVLQARETIVLDKPNVKMDATVVLERVPLHVTDDNSLLTDDDSTETFTPPKQEPPKIQPTSAVKEKVQQFEEIATRTTRTKTRAMAKKDNKDEPTDTQTPPDKTVKQLLSVDVLNKMNAMIFNGKQVSSSATKLRSNIPTAKPVSASASKLSAINKAREEAEANKREKEDARKKKEAMLEAKKELHKRKREEKMAAAAAAREMAERERRAAMEAAVKERMEKQAHADLGKLERLKEAERKKQELARKVAETEERRRAEEQARQKRLAEEQRKADEARRKQQEEAAAMKKEAALMEKEIEKRQKEYLEKQMRLRMEEKGHTPRAQPIPIEPVHMVDGFQYLNSDEEEENIPKHRAPVWSTSKVRKEQMFIQTAVNQYHINLWFGMQKRSIDLRDIFPNIERNRLKRTSSAVWRTPPSIRTLPTLAE